MTVPGSAGFHDTMESQIVPGTFVRHPTEDWGLGQVQSVAGDIVTCNFENRGKVVINRAVIPLVVVPRVSR